MCNFSTLFSIITVLIYFFLSVHSFKYIKDCECGVKDVGRLKRLATGGHDALQGTHPWFAGIVKKVKNASDYTIPFCGASLISDRYLITAGHCLFGKNVSDLAVLMDFYNLEDYDAKVNLFNISSIIVHEKYVDHLKHPEVDIGLIRLANPISINKTIRSICLPDPQQPSNLRSPKSYTPPAPYVGLLTTVGWGRTSKNGPQAEKLQQVSMPQDIDSCSLVYGEQFHENHICLKDNRNIKKGWKDVCKGDSGGPLIHRWSKNEWLVGVTSYGNCLGIPAAVFTRISSYLEWIDSNTQDSKFCERPKELPL